MKASKRAMKCQICYSEELGKVSDIEDGEERFEALNDFFIKIQNITHRETKIEFLRNWRKMKMGAKMTEEKIIKCPKCGSEIDYRGIGAYIYGCYEHYEWYCLKCGYCEEQYAYEQMEIKRISKRIKVIKDE